MIQALAQHTNDEYFRTPEHAVTGLLRYVPKEWVIWECTDTYGKSGITSDFRSNGYTVEATNFDFLTSSVESGFDCIITNPPFNKKTQFIAKCIRYGKPFALLLPLTALEGLERHKLWSCIQDNFGLLVHSKRIDFTGEGVWFNTSWFTYKMFTGVRFYANRG